MRNKDNPLIANRYVVYAVIMKFKKRVVLTRKIDISEH